MVITVNLPKETEKELVERAARSGKTVESFVGELIRRGIEKPPTMDEILAPFRAQVAESGLSDEQLDELFAAARSKVEAHKQKG